MNAFTQIRQKVRQALIDANKDIDKAMTHRERQREVRRQLDELSVEEIRIFLNDLK